MDPDSAVARAAIERNLSCYADQWRRLQEVEVGASYGPVDPEPDVIKDLTRRGTCILAATLRRGTDCTEVTCSAVSGPHIVDGVEVGIRRSHPKLDGLRQCTVSNRRGDRFELHPDVPDEDIDHVTWRLDVQVNDVPCDRLAKAIGSFTSVAPTSSPTTLHVRVGSYFWQPAAEEGNQ